MGAEFGPYLQQPPLNPFTNVSTVAAADAGSLGWVYDELTGEILASGFDELTGEFTDPGGLAP